MEQQVLTTVNSLISSFDWAEVQKVLPTNSPNQVQNVQAFQQQQQQQLADPNTVQALQGNLQRLNPLIDKLPTGGSNG